MYTKKCTAYTSMSRFDRNAVVATAIGLGDEAGLEAVSLRRPRRAIRCHRDGALSLHQGKDELLDAMADQLYADLDLPDDDADWWEGLAGLARSTRKVLLAHPWATPLFARPLTGPTRERSPTRCTTCFGKRGSPHRGRASCTTSSRTWCSLWWLQS